MITRLYIGGKDNNNPIFKDSDEPFRSLADIKEDIGNIKTNDIIMEGGEPTIHPDFLKIILIAKKSGHDIYIRTNARMLMYDKFISRISKTGIHFIVELYSDNKQGHDSISGIDGSFEQTMLGVNNLIKTELGVSIIIPAIKENISSIPKLISMLSKKDIARIYIEDIDGCSEPLLESLNKKNKKIISLYNHPPCNTGNYDTLMTSIDKEYNDDCNECFKKYMCPGLKEGMTAKPFKDGRSKIACVYNAVNSRATMPISIEDIYKTLIHIEKNPDLWEGIYDLGYPIPLLMTILDELEKINAITINGDKIASNIKLKELGAILDMSHRRLQSNPKVCQLLVGQEDLIKRVEYIKETCPSGGDLAIIGDDDFMSITLASIGLFNKIIVFEIDERIVDEINMIAAEKKLPVECFVQDVRQKMPRRYLNRFDAFYTDSPYSSNGFSLFISRGVELLKNEPNKHIFSSFSCEMPIMDVELMVQAMINKMGLFVEQKSMPAKNHVPDYMKKKYKDYKALHDVVIAKRHMPEELDKWFLAALGRKESLFHFLTTQKSRPDITGEFKEEIYYEDVPFDFYTNQNTVDKFNLE